MPHPCAFFLAQGWESTDLRSSTDRLVFSCHVSGLVRYQKCDVSHFITFSCYRRQPLLASPGAYSTFEHELERLRKRYVLVIAGYVLMPEHVHLLVGEPVNAILPIALQVLKQQTSRRLNRSANPQFWQRRYYDFNIHTEDKRVEKLRYMHRNPVVRGLCGKPEDWPWSSFRHYATNQTAADRYAPLKNGNCFEILGHARMERLGSQTHGATAQVRPSSSTKTTCCVLSTNKHIRTGRLQGHVWTTSHKRKGTAMHKAIAVLLCLCP